MAIDLFEILDALKWGVENAHWVLAAFAAAGTLIVFVALSSRFRTRR